MKTLEIQQQITNIKQAVKAYGDAPSAEGFNDVIVGLELLVKVTFETIPPKVEIKEVQVRVDVPVVQQISVEVQKEVSVPLTVEKPVEITKEIPMTKEVVKEVTTTVFVPVFTSSLGE